MEPIPEPGSSAYMVQLSNGSLQNGLINRSQLILALKTNLLFFDEVQVSAPAILRNDILYDLAIDEREQDAMKTIYRSFVRPVLLDSRADIQTVGEAIAKSDKNIGPHGKKGRKSPIVDRQTFDKNDREVIDRHAKFIASAKPTYRYASHEVSHTKFVETYLST